MLTTDIVRELLDYDALTGELTWQHRSIDWFYDAPRRTADQTQRAWNTKLAGKRAFTAKDTAGYHHGSILGIKYLAHRVAWLHHYGEWPADQLDHENHIRTDNSILNLANADATSNRINQSIRRTNTSGHQGVVWYPKRGKWAAQIKLGGKRKFFGLFANKEDAIAVRKQAEIDYGFHKNHGMEKAA